MTMYRVSAGAMLALAVSFLVLSPSGITHAREASKALPTEQISEADARLAVAPLYEALNEPAKKDVAALLAKATTDDYSSCSTNTDCLNREQLVHVFEAIGKSIPDLRWSIKDLWVSGNRIIVRGEATGTPVAEFFGAKPTGKSFRTISLDVFTVRDGKLASAYHVENWTAAIEQIK